LFSSEQISGISMWPKQNFETGFGDWRNRSSGGMGWGGGGGGRNMGGNRNWKSWQGGNRGNQTNYQKKAKAKPTQKKPAKRSLSKTGTKTKAVANKRQKVVVKYSQIPLTKVMLVNPGTKEGELPELVFGGFYDCAREAKVGKPRHLLQIEVSKKNDKKKRDDKTQQAEWKVSIPVPSTSVEAVSILSGTNPFEKLLKAHSDRISLNHSIEHWNKVIRGRTTALQKKEEELLKLQEIEDEIEKAPEPKMDEDAEPEDEAAKEADVQKTDSSPTKSESETKASAEEAEDDDEEATEDKETEESKEELEKKKKKEKETRIRKMKFVTSVIKKLTSAVDKAKQSLALEQAKLDKIGDELGDELAYFQNEITDDEALAYFKEQLQEAIQVTDEPEKDSDKEDANDKEDTNDKETEDAEMVEDSENLDKSKASDEETSDVEMADAKDKAAEETEKAESEENVSVEEVKKVKSPEKKPENGKVTEIPVWLIVSLKKPLEKAIVSTNAPVSTEDHIKKASMIIMKFQPKHKKTIVLKGVTYQGSEEYLKVLNQVLEGPWKAVRKDPEELMKTKSSFSLMGTLKYLVMCQTRREVTDNIMENCEQCEKPFKHSAMKKHLKEFCPMREEECEFCTTVFAVSSMEEHHDSECMKYPISCPAKCSKKFAREEAEDHKQVCQNALVDCEYENFGCSKQLKRKEHSRHLKIAVFEHLELVKGRVTILTDYMMKSDPALQDIIKPRADTEPKEGESFV